MIALYLHLSCVHHQWCRPEDAARQPILLICMALLINAAPGRRERKGSVTQSPMSVMPWWGVAERGGPGRDGVHLAECWVTSQSRVRHQPGLLDPCGWSELERWRIWVSITKKPVMPIKIKLFTPITESKEKQGVSDKI